MNSCLNADQLRMLKTGKLPRGERSQAWQHVSTCERCQEALDALSSDPADQRYKETTPIGERVKPQTHLADAPASVRDSLEGYELYGEIHRGGQGVVYKASQTRTKRTVAVKILLAGRFASPRQRYRFEREIDLVANLQHPNIVTIYDSGVTPDGQPYYAMEYIHGRPISGFVEEKGLSEEETLRLFIKVCNAVHHAHLRGVIHRDLKPANILVDSHGEPHVLDFGLAKMAGSGMLGDGSPVTITGEFMGTLAYASPEQVEGDPNLIDIRSDVYSLGVVLYQLLTGEFPYPVVGDMGEILRNVREAEPTRPSTIRHQIGDEVETIALTALSKDQERRYQTAESLGRDLQRFLDGDAIEAKRDSGLYLLRKTLARYRVPVAIGAAFLVLIVAGSIGLIVSYQRQIKATELAEKKTKEAVEARGEAETARIEAERAKEKAQESEKIAAEHAEQLRHTLYANRLALAENALAQNRASRLGELLRDCPEDLRGWEWYRLQWLADRSLLTIGEGRQLGKVVVSDHSARIVTASFSLGVQVWDGDSGELESTLGGRSPRALACSPDGRLIAAGIGDEVWVWDRASRERIHRLAAHQIPVHALAFRADGKRLASGSDGIGVWNTETGELLGSMSGHYAGVTALDFSPDGSALASAGRDGTVRLWHMDDTGPAIFKGHQSNVTSVAFGPDGKRIVSGGEDRTVRVWDITAGTEVATLRGHQEVVRFVGFSGSGDQVLSAGDDRSIRTWSVATWEEGEAILGHRYGVLGAALTEDGEHLVTVDSVTVKRWDLDSAQPGGTPDLTMALKSGAGGLPVAVNDAAFSPDGKRIVVGTGYSAEFFVGRYSLRVLDAVSGRQIFSPQLGWQVVRSEEPVNAVEFSADGTLVLSGSGDRTVRLWNAADGKIARILRGHEAPVLGAWFVPGTPRILSVDDRGTVLFWDARTGDRLESFEGRDPTDLGSNGSPSTEPVRVVALRPDGGALLVGTATRLVLRDLHTRDILQRWDFHGGLSTTSFSSNGERVFTGEGSGIVRVWDVATGQDALTPRSMEEPVTVVVQSPDARRFLTGGRTGIIKVWHAETGEELLTLRGHNRGVSDIFFSPDGKRMASTSEDGVVRIWKSPGF